MLAELRTSLAAKEVDKFRRTAHSLKSNANTFGALTLAGMARDIELGGLAGMGGRGSQPLDALSEEYARVAAALGSLRNG